MKYSKGILALVSIVLSFSSCQKENVCTSGVENGFIQGAVKLAGTGEPVEGISLILYRTETTGGFPPSTNYIEMDTMLSSNLGFYSFSGYETDKDWFTVRTTFDRSLYYSCSPKDNIDVKSTGCGINKDFVAIPKAKLKVNIGIVNLPDSIIKGSIYGLASGHFMTFTKDEPLSGSVVIPVLGNISDTLSLILRKRVWVVNRYYPNGIEGEVIDTIVKIPFFVEAWEEDKLEINYP